MGDAPGTPMPDREQRRLLFRSGGERFSVDLESVREITPPQEATPVPLVPDTVAGIINHRGAIVTVLHFARLAGVGEDRPGALVLLRLPEMAVALAVESIEGIERAPAGPAPAAGGALPSGSFLRRERDASGRAVRAVDAHLLADTICRITDPAHAGSVRHEDAHA